mgnify:CR=1 FL=1
MGKDGAGGWAGLSEETKTYVLDSQTNTNKLLETALADYKKLNSAAVDLQIERDELAKKLFHWDECHKAIGDMNGCQLGSVNKPLSVAASYSLLLTERDRLLKLVEQYREAHSQFVKRNADLEKERDLLKAEVVRVNELRAENFRTGSEQNQQLSDERDMLKEKLAVAVACFEAIHIEAIRLNNAGIRNDIDDQVDRVLKEIGEE